MRLYNIIKELANRLKIDYVVEEGSTNGWDYKKWNSGRCELTRQDSSVTGTLFSTTAFGGYTYYTQINFPFALVGNYTISGSGYLGTNLGFLHGRPYPNTFCRIYVLGNENNSSMSYQIKVDGWWKSGGVVETLINRAIGGVRYAFI